jgi:site-specific recombinase XerD
LGPAQRWYRNVLSVHEHPSGSLVNDQSSLLGDWARQLRAHNLSPRTISSYRQTGQALAAHLAGHGMPTDVTAITREHIETWLAGMNDEGRAAATVARHYRSLQQL